MHVSKTNAEFYFRKIYSGDVSEDDISVADEVPNGDETEVLQELLPDVNSIKSPDDIGTTDTDNDEENTKSKKLSKTKV